jgi:phosphate transport system substrate-binding protein
LINRTKINTAKMKTFKIIIATMILLIAFSCGESRVKGKKQKITISGAFALYPLTVKWAEIYMKENPLVQIDISAGGAGKGMTDVLSDMVEIAMMSREIEQSEVDKGAFAIAVAKDAVIPVFNSGNPLCKQILEKGSDSLHLANIFIAGTIHNWNEVISIPGAPVEMHVYTRSDACGAAAMWASFFGKNQEDLSGTGVFGDPGIAEAVKNDIYGVGYNNVVYVFDLKTRKKTQGLEILPLDLNSNGKIDPEENFYDNVDSFIEAIKKDKFPSPPARKLYMVTKGKPNDLAVVSFLKWILENGQQYVEQAGYVNFSQENIQKELKKLD